MAVTCITDKRHMSIVGNSPVAIDTELDSGTYRTCARA